VFALNQNYPNPFNPTTTISFSLPKDGMVSITVYNILGQEIATLLDNESFYAGNQQVTFDATSFTSGVYFYRISATMTNDDGSTKNVTQTKKMMLMK